MPFPLPRPLGEDWRFAQTVMREWQAILAWAPGLARLLLCALLVSPRLQAAEEIRTILVFPFENQSSRPDLNWISESFPTLLSPRLTRPENYVLGKEERDAACAQLGLPSDTPLTLASEFKIAQTLGVDWAIVGDFNVTGDRLTARARLLDMRQVKLTDSMEVAGELADLVDLQSRLAWRLLGTHDPEFTVGKEVDFLRLFPEVRLDAFENYVRGILAADDESRAHFFQEADHLSPADHQAAFALGRLYFDQKDYANSAKWLQKLQEPDAHYLESLFLLGVDEYFLGHEQAAEHAFETLARQLPLNEVFNNLGVLKARRGQYMEALANFDRAYQSDPTEPDISFNRGVCLWYLNRYRESAQALEEAVRNNDDDSEAHTLLAVVLRKLGDTTGEKRESQWLAEHEVGLAAEMPRDILPRTRLQKHYNGRAFKLLALTLHNALEDRLAGLPAEQHSQVHLARGKQFFTEGRLPEAERELTEAVSLVPGDSEARVALAKVLDAEGHHREAAAELDTSLKLKNSAAAHVALGWVYVSLAQPQLARKQGEAALQIEPDNQEAEQLMKQLGSDPPQRKSP